MTGRPKKDPPKQYPRVAHATKDATTLATSATSTEEMSEEEKEAELKRIHDFEELVEPLNDLCWNVSAEFNAELGLRCD